MLATLPADGRLADLVHLPTVISTTGVSRPEHREKSKYSRAGGVSLVEGVRYYDGVLMRQELDVGVMRPQVTLGGGVTYTVDGWVRTVQGGPLLAKVAPATAKDASGAPDQGVAACLYVAHGQLQFMQRSLDGSVTVEARTERQALGDGEWHHVALTQTVDNAQSQLKVRLFINGEAAAAAVSTGGVSLSAEAVERSALAVGYGSRTFPPNEFALDAGLREKTEGWSATEGGQTVQVGRNVLIGQLAHLTYWQGVALEPGEIHARFSGLRPPEVAPSLGLPSFTHLDLYNPGCTKVKYEEEEVPYTLVLLGNLRSFPLMVHPIDRLICDYTHRQWMVVAALAERVQHSDRAWWMKEVVPETMIAPALTHLRELNASYPALFHKFCHVFEATVISKERLEQALPARLVRDIDIHRDPRGHCAYNEKLARLKLEYMRIALERTETLHMARRGAPLPAGALVLVTRPDVDLNHQGSHTTVGLDQMAAAMEADPKAVFLHKNQFGMSDQWFIASAGLLRELTSLDLSCAFAGIREHDKYCPFSESYLLYLLRLVCAKVHYVDKVLGAFKMMRAETLSFPRQPEPCNSRAAGNDHVRGGPGGRTVWQDFNQVQAEPTDFLPGKSRGMFMNETIRARYCQEPIFCSAAAMGVAGLALPKQEDASITP